MSSSKQFRVFAIVVTYNGEQWMEKCLGSLRRSEYPVTTIVVDNLSKDGTVEVIKRDFPEVHLIESDVNHGFGKGNNIAMAHALDEHADYFFLLNQDAWIEPTTIGTLVSAMQTNGQYGVLSPVHYTGSGLKMDLAFKGYIEKLYSNLNSASSDILEVDFINAAAWMVSRMCIEKVGGFGDLFRHYGEDRDYVQRLRYYGFKIGFVASVKAFHDREGKSFDLSVREKFVWYYTTGLITRLSDPNGHLPALLFRNMFWFGKDALWHLLKFRIFVITAFFQIWSEITKKRQDISHYRERIIAGTPYLFIK